MWLLWAVRCSAGVAVAGVVVVSGVVGVVLVPVAPPATVVVPAAVGTVVAVAAVPPSRERNCLRMLVHGVDQVAAAGEVDGDDVGNNPRLVDTQLHAVLQDVSSLAAETTAGSARPFLLTQWLMRNIGAEAGPRLGWQSKPGHSGS